MSEWKKVALADCCLSIADGDHQPPPKAENGIPFVTISNITSTNQFDFSDCMYVPQDYYDGLDTKRKAQKGDVLYSVVGSFGIPVLMKEDLKFVFQRHIAILRPDETKVNPAFLYYTMLSRDFYAKADAAAIGAAQRTVSLSALRSITIDLPDIETQCRIASILSAYDFLIENNQHQIKLLEEAAQRLYKEWFVDLRFPGWEQTKIVDGVPEGWKKDRADLFFTITIGKTPPRAEKRWFSAQENGKNLPWLSIADMGISGPYQFNTSEFLTPEAVEQHNVKVIPEGTVLLSFKLTVGRVAIATQNMCTNEAIAHFIITDPTQREYLYWYLKCFEYQTLGSTSSISTAINSKIVKAMPVIIPSGQILSAFHNSTMPIMNRIKALQKQILYLGEARDRLLPKLMSGEMEIL